MEVGADYIYVSKKDKMKPVHIKTLGYPGFPTDLQQPITALLTQCEGESVLQETVYENRFKNVPYLNSMGANITQKQDTIYIKGKTKLQGKTVEATDLRAGACLVLAGLVAEGTTTIRNIGPVLRGYENIIEKLNEIGADVKIVEEE